MSVNGTGVNPTPTSPYMTVAEVADLLRTTPAAIYAKIERHQLPGVIKLGRRRLIARADLIEFLNQNRAPSPKETMR